MVSPFPENRKPVTDHVLGGFRPVHAVTALGGFFIASLFFYAAWETEKRQVDVSGCLLSPKNARDVTAIIIDSSSGFSEREAGAIKTLLERIDEGSKTDSLMLFYRMDDKNPIEPTPFYRKCRPQAKATNEFWNQNERDIKLKLEAHRKNRNENIDRVLQVSSTENSPIIEMITGITKSKDMSNEDSNKRIIVISDMLQLTQENNKTVYSQYSPLSFPGGVFKPEIFQKTNGYEKLKYDMRDYQPAISGTTLDVSYIDRLKQGLPKFDTHRQFWINIFSDFGYRQGLFQRIIQQ